MSVAIREQVVRAFAALLEGLEDGNGDAVSVERGRDTAVSEYPTVVIQEGAETGRETSYGQQDLTMTVTVAGFVQQAAGEGDVDGARAAWEAAKTDLYARVVQAVLAEPRTLGGLAVDMRFVSMSPEIAMEASVETGGFVVVFEVDYWTMSGNPFSQATGA